MINNSMKQIIKEILNTVPENARRNHLSTQHIDYLNKIYPIDDFAYQCYLILNDAICPKCAICSNIPARNKETCSRKCREELKKLNGKDSFSAMKSSMMEKYGVDNPAKVKEIQQKRIATNIKKYGSKVSKKTRDSAKSRAGELFSKGRETLMSKYGVDNPGQLPDHAIKTKSTILENYGTENYFSSDEWAIKSKLRALKKLNNITSSYIEIIDIDGADSDIINAYVNPNKRIVIHCNRCNSNETIPSETFKYRLQNYQTPCGKCANIKGPGSAAEKEIVNFIKSIYSGDVLENNRSIIAPYELDIVLPELNVAIEYCGLYWHNDNRVDKKYHHNKMIECAAKGIQLFTIFEDEWIHKSDVVKQRLKNKLSLTPLFEKVGARKCQIVDLTARQARDFVDKHHIQGYTNASVKKGLIYNDEVVAVMTFSKSNIAKKQLNWELSRFCIKENFQIQGAAGKLFKAFINEYNPDIVVTFSDLRWNTGEVYSKIGFKFSKWTGLNYWYILGNKRIHRFALRKKSDEPTNLTETQLRSSEGWNRIWDCGNAKYVWNP
jgi:hypothetical protein